MNLLHVLKAFHIIGLAKFFEKHAFIGSAARLKCRKK